MSQPGKSETVVKLDETQPQGGQQKPEAGAGGDGGDQQPRLYGGKFATVEELEAAFAAAQQPADDKGGEGGSSLEIEETTEDDARDALSKAGLNLDDFASEFNSNGKLSDESYEKLAKAGYPKDLVDVYVDGLGARRANYENTVFAAAGGADQYKGLVQWAKTNLNADQKRAFNEAVTSGDAQRAALAVQGIVALRGGSGRLIAGKTAPNADIGPKPFLSQTQVTDAMRDPRYARDPAYRKEVAERLRVSNLFR